MSAQGLSISGLYVSFNGLEVFRDFSMEFSPQKITCILGPSGCGKTTLLNVLAGLLKPDAGAIAGLQEKAISCIFQEDRLMPWKTASENIRFVLKNRMVRNEQEEQIGRYLHMVGLDGFAGYYPSQLSGGMRQRVSIARAFSFPSDCILMDEPFKGLDIATKGALMQSINALWEHDKRTAVYVTHDLEEALYFGHRIVVFSQRPVQVLGEFGQTEEDRASRKNSRELHHAIKALFKAWD
jgi:NitT/TauT family transport system ATP-binding protein